MLFAVIISRLLGWIDVAVMVGVAALCALAFFHCLVRTRGVQFERAFKRTRTFWLAVTGVSFALTALMAVPALAVALAGGTAGMGNLFIPLLTATACGVYLADVKPAVDVESSGPSAW